jgi:hypothetical protein
MTKKRSWAEDYADITTKDQGRLRLNGKKQEHETQQGGGAAGNQTSSGHSK